MLNAFRVVFYAFVYIEFRMGENSSWMDVNKTIGCSFERSDYVPNVYKVTIRPDYQDVAGDITLRVKGEQHGRYSIVWENIGEQYLDLEKSVLPEQAIDGDTVIAELWTTEDYYLAGAECQTKDIDLAVISRSYVRFIMPASNVTVVLDIKGKIPVSYIKSAHIKEAVFYDADDMYYGVETDKGIPGEVVYLFATAESGFSCASEVQPGLCCSTGRREQEATAGKITTVQKTAWARSHPGAVQLTGPQVREHRIT